MHKFKELNVWQKSVDLAVDVYSLTKKFPPDERFGLISQLNRCAVSIPSNIAEGAGRNSKNEFNHFLGISVGSAFELETQLVISQRLNFINSKQLESVLTTIHDIQHMTYGLQSSLKNKIES
jgi:four helix bundle protein